MLLTLPGLTTGTDPEPNWLLSSAAQCGSALVAIVAGLLVTRLLTLRTERAAHGRAAGQYRRRREAAEKLRDSIRKDVTRDQALAWLTLCLTKIVQTFRASPNGLLRVDQLRQFASTSLTDEQAQPVLNEVVERLRAASSEVRAALADYQARGGGPLPESWQRARTVLHLPHREEETAVYEYLWAAEHADVERARRPPSGAVAARVSRSPSPVGSLVDFRVQASREAALEQAERDVARHQLEEDLATAAADAVPATAKVTWALIVLGYMSVVNMLIPLGLLVQQPTQVDGWLRTVVFVLFVTGIGAMLIYLVWGFRDEVRKPR